MVGCIAQAFYAPSAFRVLLLIVDYENRHVHLLARITSAEHFVGATYLLGSLYAITTKSSDVLIYTGHSPYDLSQRIHVDGMVAVDIATCYVNICVYILDNGNGRVSRIDRKHTLNTFIDGLQHGDLIRMSVTSDGRLTIIQRNSKILTYDKDGNVVGVMTAPVESILHALEVAVDKSVFLFVVNTESCTKIAKDGREIRRHGGIDCRYVDISRARNLIACDSFKDQVVQLNPETLQVTDTLLTLDRDGIEHPEHVRCVLENRLMLVSWWSYLDVYSFDENATQGYLASTDHDVRNQRIREANELLNEITQSRAFLQLRNAPELDYFQKIAVTS